MMDEGDDGLNLAARILIFAWPATSVSQIHKGCHRHSWRKKGERIGCTVQINPTIWLF